MRFFQICFFSFSFIFSLNAFSRPKPKQKNTHFETIVLLAKTVSKFLSLGPSTSSHAGPSLYLRSQEGASLLFHEQDLTWIAENIPQLNQEILSSREHSPHSTADTIDLPQRSYVLLQFISFLSRNFEEGTSELLSSIPHLRFESFIRELRSLNSSTLNSFFISALRRNYELELNHRDSLEARYAKEWFRYVDVHEPYNFYRDCRIPNEFHPEAMHEHLHETMLERGVLVSVGSERSFFALLQSPERIEGLIGRDLNPKIIAYMHFNNLLFKISRSIDEYRELSSSKISNFHCYIENIIIKIYTSSMEPSLKRFYIFHLKDFAEAYLDIDQEDQWKRDLHGHFEAVAYYKYTPLFRKLQHYALSGNMIFTLGDVNDLKFINEDTVSVVDTSNVWAYSLLDFKLSKMNEYPRILWTYLPTTRNPNTAYHSYEFYSLTEEDEREDAKLLINSILEALSYWEKKPLSALKFFNDPDVESDFNVIPSTAITLQAISRFRDLANRIEELPHFGPFIYHTGMIYLINNADSKTLDRFVVALSRNNSEAKRIKAFLVPYSSELRSDFVFRVFPEL